MASLPVNNTTGNETGGSLKGKQALKFMLNNPEYSDMTVFAGVSQTSFNLHRAVMCIGSGFLKACCDSSSFQEGTTKAVYLAEIESEVFQKIVLWLYEEEYEYTWTNGNEDLKLIQAADLLKIEGFRADILYKFSLKLRYQVGTLGVQSKAAEELLRNFVKICHFCEETNIKALIYIMRKLLPYVKVTPKMVLAGLTDGSFGKIFMAALVGAQSEVGCSECGGKIIGSGGKRKRI
ncbi:hypothetical protein AOL_s00110g213 [Orbilia oligospora ATCC 24927]|uniref:BTB domain-containing protein n=1 Tax=Arthrobotrys oligospora (strain ATCC 24927 / CBS 115.81 / DSM 1491) TaxID=756982 RepID=G1XL43_ARTOA|nr:hypothetical protein AOL_s00110g213 [Orbilia oligospora ATCC 24927]EGX46049.1 hypothetical protein AOL_s00110g213 [Orbilia oligospora ATCC 24927]